NGAPFNGAGSGYYYNANAANIGGDANNFGINNVYAAPDPTNPGSLLTPYPVALLPNIGGYDTTQGRTYDVLGNLNVVNSPLAPYDLGGLDETWDAPDLQNMFLAMIPPRAAYSYYNSTS